MFLLLHTRYTVNMSSSTKACKICGLILMLIMGFMLLQTFAFGSSASAQKRSSDCLCSLSCDGAEAKLKKHEIVEVDVEHKSDPIYSKNLTVSSLFAEKGRCSVVVPKCLQGYKQVQLKIFVNINNKSQTMKSVYENMDLKPDCDTEKPPEERSGADGISSNTLLILMIIGSFVVFKFLPKNWCHFNHRTRHSTPV